MLAWQLLLQATDDLEKVEELVVKQGADVNARDVPTGASPLHLAAARGSLAHVKWYLAHGARWNQRDMQSRLALDMARKHGHEDCYEAIIEVAVASGASARAMLAAATLMYGRQSS